MREMKDSGVEWIGEIPNSWSILPLARILAEHSRKNIGNAEQNVLSLSYGNIIRRDVTDNMGLIPESFETYNIIEPGHIVLRLTDLQNDQRSLRTGLVKERGIITSAYLTLTSKLEIDSRYFHYLLHTYDAMKIIYNMGNGVRQNLKFSELAKLPLPIPSIKEQHRIADYLDTKCEQIDRAIARQQEVIEKLKEYKLSVITEAVTKGLNPDVPMKDSGIEWIGEIPEHWCILKLKYIASILRGKFNHRPRNDPDYYDGEYPFVQTGDVAQADKYITGYSQTLNELGYSVSKEFPRGSIVMTIAANVGDVAILDFNACFPDSVVGLIPNAKIETEVLYFILKAMKSQLTRNAIISTQLNLNIEIIKEEYVPVADINEQLRIEQYLNEKCNGVEMAICSKQSIIDKLTEYKKSLIYEVVTGKREV